MATIKIMGQAKVKTIKETFRKEMGVDIEIYNQEGNPALEDVTLGSIRTKSPKSTELKIVGQSKVKTVEAYFEDNYGIKVDILNPNGDLADDDSTLGDTKRLYSDTSNESEVDDSAKLEEMETEKEEIMARKHKNDFKSSDADLKPYMNNRINGSGYFCVDCGADDEFQGTFDLYRRYTPDNEDGFDYEILVPSELACCNCDSKNIAVKVADELTLNVNETELCDDLALVDDHLVCFDTEQGWLVLFKLLGCSKNFCEFVAKNPSDEWFSDHDEFGVDFDMLERSKEVVLEISCSGIVEKESDILLCGDSSYKGSRIFVYFGAADRNAEED